MARAKDRVLTTIMPMTVGLYRDLDHTTDYGQMGYETDQWMPPLQDLKWQLGRWFGYKTICYNTDRGVMLESWVDVSGNGSAWKRMFYLEDTGQ
jgi:hypothetical protein